MTTRRLFSVSGVLFTIAVVLAAIVLPCQKAEAKKIDREMPRRFTFKIDPATPLKDLLPAPPKTPMKLAPYPNEDLWEVTELTFGAPVAKEPDSEKDTAHIIAKINHLNQKDPEGFLKALVANRPDLLGLPFLMGKDCRTEAARAQLFSETVGRIQHLQEIIKSENVPADPIPYEEYLKQRTAQYWNELASRLTKDKSRPHWNKSSLQERERMMVAALTQIFAPESAADGIGMARYLTALEHVDATNALAKLAVFAPEEAVRTAAIDGLKKRPAKDGYARILMQGVRYPLPVVSTRAADALVKLKCNEVLADLVNVLEEPDPRAPTKQMIDGKEVTAVRELVRVNHHRNCLLCHAPANTEGVPRDVLTAPVPLPNQELLTSPGGYGRDRSPDIFIRTDITYLRQDFSMMMRVENPSPWPEMQRFDFLVRTRFVTPEDAAECQKQLAKAGTPPSHIAARSALRALTRQSPADDSPATWRRIVDSLGK